MKVGFDYTIADLNGAGSGVYARNLFTSLQQRAAGGSDLQMLPLRMASNFARRRHSGGLRRIAVVYRSLIGRNFDMPYAAARAGIDLLHSPANFLPLRSAMPTVVTMLDTTVQDFPQGFNLWQRIDSLLFTRRSLENARLILTVSESAKRDILRVFSLAESKIHVTPLAASHHFQPLTHSEAEATKARFGLGRYVFIVGTLEPRKNHVGLITAFLEARRRGYLHDVQLVHAGAPTWKTPAGLDIAARLGADMKFLGYVEQRDLATITGAAEALAFPSFYEGFGLPVVEAMQCGTPVIAADLPVLREVAGDAALYADPHSVPAMADALIAVMADPQQRSHMRERGTRRAAAFSWAECARRTELAYRLALAG